MPSAIVGECPCCMTHRAWHCRDCWDKYHNGKRDNDFVENEELFRKSMFETHPKLKEIMEGKVR